MQVLRASRGFEQGLVRGRSELRAALRGTRGLIWCVALFGVAVNLLLLTGPLYMLQVYDRVLSSRSVETLLVLSVLVLFLFSVMAVLDFVRARLMARIAARLQVRLRARVFEAGLRHAARGSQEGLPQALRDLGAVQQVLAAPIMITLLDLPWTPLFLLGIFVFHPWLGLLACGGAVVLIGLAMFNQFSIKDAEGEAARAAAHAARLADDLGAGAQTARALGMQQAALAHWSSSHAAALKTETAAGDLGGGFAAASRGLRLILQSAMLGLGAFWVLRGALSPGAMIATSVLTGRALAPVEQVIGGWPVIQRGMKAWRALGAILAAYPPLPPRTELPRPAPGLHVSLLSVAPPEARMPVLRGVGFEIGPGQAVGVIGASGAGKTALAHAITGLWPPYAGQIRLGRTPIEAFTPDARSRHIGYLPQRVDLFEGTVAQNIARMAPDAATRDVIKAARAAGAHEMILALPDGYDTRLCSGGGALSGGQVQRIALARALYGDPVLLILDEPNSNLDNVGSAAVNAAIRRFKAAGKAVLVMAHRPAAIQECDHLLLLEGGTVRQFGPRDEVLRAAVRNHAQLLAGGADRRYAADGMNP